MSLTDKLRAVFGRLMGRATQRGYMYVPEAEATATTAIEPGREIRVARTGPWLVVDHDISSIIVAKWPGRLWLVDVVDPITPAEMRALGSELRADAGYTRACGVKVIDEVPLARLFGAKGDAVVNVIDTARALTLETATRLAAARDAHAGEAQTRLWKKWLAGQTPPVVQQRDDLDGTLSIGRLRSPVGSGLSVIHAEVGKRAEAVAGKSVWIVEQGSDDAWLAEPWSSASATLIDAALSFAVSEVSNDDREILSKAWRDVIGQGE